MRQRTGSKSWATAAHRIIQAAPRRGQAPTPQGPICFVSYSTHESYVPLLIECIQIALTPPCQVELTPSALQSGASQRDQITRLIRKCDFGVVILDGLRPNVVFEYGILHGLKKPVILFKEAEAQVSLEGFLRDAPVSVVGPMTLNLDQQFSDVKDVCCVQWKRYEVRNTIRTVWSEYRKKSTEIPGYVDIPEPKL